MAEETLAPEVEHNEERAKEAPPLFFRWSVLVFVSLTVFGSYLAYDCIGPVTPMLKSLFNFDSRQIGLLYSIYSIPNIVMVFLGGYIIDRIGTRRAGLLYAVIVFTGTAIVAFAPYIHWIPSFILSWLPPGWTPEYIWMLIGRFVFGLGSESLIVAQSTILGKWFREKELAFAFGINLSISRLGTIAAFLTFGWVAERSQSVYPVLWTSVLFCAVAVLTFIIYIFLENTAQNRYALAPDQAQDRITLADIAAFPPSFWYTSTLCVLFYSCIFPFTTFSTDFFCEKWHFDQTYGSRISSIIMIFSMFCTPIFGALIDRYGKRGKAMMAGSLILIPTYVVLGYTNIHPIYPMCVMGIAFSLVPAAMWPSLPLIIEESRLGTAYGLMTMIQNLGLAVFPFVIGWVRDYTGNYSAAMLVFSSLGVIGFIFSILLTASERERLEKGRT